MTNGSLSPSHVTAIQDDGQGTVTINVQFGGFLEGANVEISGFLAQTSGAYVPFSATKPVPAGDPKSGLATIPLQVDVSGLPKNLDEYKDVIVVTRVAETWPTVLEWDEKSKSWVAKGPWGGGPQPPPTTTK